MKTENTGKSCLNKLATFSAIFALAFSLSACDFFGKKKVEETATIPGTLGDGLSIVGTWSAVYGDTSDTRNPTVAYSETFSFDPAQGARIELKDNHDGGISCTAFAQYRIYGNDVLIYVQAVSAPMCGFNSVIKMQGVKIDSSILTYSDESNRKMTYFAAKTPAYAAPVGLWDFKNAGADQNGNGGFEWILFDGNGYFLVQTVDSGERFLVQGFYKITKSQSTGQLGIALTFFAEDPNHPYGSPIIFDNFATSGTALQLGFKNQDGSDGSYLGIRL